MWLHATASRIPKVTSGMREGMIAQGPAVLISARQPVMSNPPLPATISPQRPAITGAQAQRRVRPTIRSVSGRPLNVVYPPQWKAGRLCSSAPLRRRNGNGRSVRRSHNKTLTRTRIAVRSEPAHPCNKLPHRQERARRSRPAQHLRGKANPCALSRSQEPGKCSASHHSKDDLRHRNINGHSDNEDLSNKALRI